MKSSLVIVSVIALMFIIIGFIPISFADSNITVVQTNFNSQQSATQATCTYLTPVLAGNTLVVSLDAAFINDPVTSISDTRGDPFSSIGFALNSASTWVRVWESPNIIHSGSDVVTINYTSPSTGSYQITCDEISGNVNFTNAGAQGANQVGCNTCNMNLSATAHKVNLLYGWSDSSTAGYTGFAYHGGFSAGGGSGTCQAISGQSTCIVMFHGFSDTAVAVGPNSAVTLNCSPACNQAPNFEMDFYVANISLGVTTVTSTLTGWQFPSFSNCPSGTCGISVSWLFGMLVLLMPVGIIDSTIIAWSRNLERSTMIFLNLGGLTMGAIIGAMFNFLPTALPFIIGLFFIIYLWKGRG